MLIYVHRPEGNLGPYSREELYTLVEKGTVGPNEFAWYEGSPEWVPVQKIIPPIPKEPFIPPPPEAANAAAVWTRKKFLNHEANIRSLALLYYLGGGFTLLLGAFSVVSILKRLLSSTAPAIGGGGLISAIVIASVLLVVGAIQIWLAKLYRSLDSRAIVPGTILAVIGLLGIPLGTLINAYILYLLHSQEGKAVFSEQYQEIIEVTPDIQYRTSIVVKIALGLLAAFLVLVLIGLILHALAHA